jgi:hypothetical protein
MRLPNGTPWVASLVNDKGSMRIILTLLLLCVSIFAQQPQANDKPVKPPVSTDAPPLDAGDVKAYVDLQTPINAVNERLSRIINAARDGKEKSAAEKAANWTELELIFAQGVINQGKYDGWLGTMQEKYQCKLCIINIAPDGKTLFLRAQQPAK